MWVDGCRCTCEWMGVSVWVGVCVGECRCTCGWVSVGMCVGMGVTLKTVSPLFCKGSLLGRGTPGLPFKLQWAPTLLPSIYPQACAEKPQLSSEPPRTGHVRPQQALLRSFTRARGGAYVPVSSDRQSIVPPAPRPLPPRPN